MHAVASNAPLLVRPSLDRPSSAVAEDGIESGHDRQRLSVEPPTDHPAAPTHPTTRMNTTQHDTRGENNDEDDDDDLPSDVAYERVLGAVDKNTGGPGRAQSATVSERALRTVCCAHGELSPEQFKSTTKRAVTNDDLFSHQGATGTYHFCRQEPEALIQLVAAWSRARHTKAATRRVRSLIKTVLECDGFDTDERQAVISWANCALQVLSDMEGSR